MDAKITKKYLQAYSVLVKHGLEVELNNTCFSVIRYENPGHTNLANFDTVDELVAFTKGLSNTNGVYVNGHKLSDLEAEILPAFFSYADNVWCELPDVLDAHSDVRNENSEEEITNAIINLRKILEK